MTNVQLPVISEKTFNAAYDEVARILNYEDTEELGERLDDVAEEANDNGLQPEEKMVEMVRFLREVGTPLAMRCSATLVLGYDVGRAS